MSQLPAHNAHLYATRYSKALAGGRHYLGEILTNLLVLEERRTVDGRLEMEKFGGTK